MFQLEGGQDGAAAVGQVLLFQKKRRGFLEIFQRLLDRLALRGRAGFGIVSHQPSFGFAGINDCRERLHAAKLNDAGAIGKWGKTVRTARENFPSASRIFWRRPVLEFIFGKVTWFFFIV